MVIINFAKIGVLDLGLVDLDVGMGAPSGVDFRPVLNAG